MKSSKSSTDPSSGLTDLIPSSPHTLAEILAVLFALLFLFQCMLLPLVGKAALSGSGSPGAERAEWAGQNIRFFTQMLTVTLVAGVAAFVMKWKLYKQGAAFPRLTAVLLVSTVALAAAFAAGLLHI